MNRRLALYSESLPPQTDAMDAAVDAWLPHGATVGYLPSSPDPSREFFSACAERYARRGYGLEFFGLEDEFDAGRIPALLSLPAIHLTGGNTFQFAYWLSERGLGSLLPRYVANGGVLIGESAGAILMTPDIGSSRFCGDSPYLGVASGSGLGLVDFGIWPHYEPSDTNRILLGAYALEIGRTVYGIPDGGGILIDGTDADFFGEVHFANPA